MMAAPQSGVGLYRPRAAPISPRSPLKACACHRDRVRTVSLSLHNRALTVFGFSPLIALVSERRVTNAQILDYERTESPPFHGSPGRSGTSRSDTVRAASSETPRVERSSDELK